MDEASEQSGDGLPWFRDNDRMPGRSVNNYVRIPVEAAATRLPRDEVINAAESDVDRMPVAPRKPRQSADSQEKPDPGSLNGRPVPDPLATHPNWLQRTRMRSSGRSRSIGRWLLSTIIVLTFLCLLVTIGIAVVSLPGSTRLAIALGGTFLAGLLSYPLSRWLLGMAKDRRFRVESLDRYAHGRSSTIEALGRRAELRSRSQSNDPVPGEQDERRKRLLRYLSRHPVGKRDKKPTWEGLGLSSGTLKVLERSKYDLLATRRPGTLKPWPVEDWLDAFDERFLAPLDLLALDRIEHHAWRTFIATAASPGGWADGAITLTAGCSLLADLGSIYNLPVRRVAGILLLFRLLADHGPTPRLPASWLDQTTPANENRRPRDDASDDPLRDSLRSLAPSLDSNKIESLLSCGALRFGLRPESALRHYDSMRRIGIKALALLRPTEIRRSVVVHPETPTLQDEPNSRLTPDLVSERSAAD